MMSSQIRSCPRNCNPGLPGCLLLLAEIKLLFCNTIVYSRRVGTGEKVNKSRASQETCRDTKICFQASDFRVKG